MPTSGCGSTVRAAQPTAAVRDNFKEFLAKRPGAAAGDDRERLFQEFLKWSQSRERREVMGRIAIRQRQLTSSRRVGRTSGEGGFMSAPFRGREQSRDEIEDRLLYAPRWARERLPGDAGSTRLTSSPPLAPGKDGRKEAPALRPLPPRFEGDIAVEALRRQLSLDPVIMPEPPIGMRRTPWAPWLARLLAMFMLAAVGAFGFTWITSREVTSSHDPRHDGGAGDRSVMVASSVRQAQLTARRGC